MSTKLLDYSSHCQLQTMCVISMDFIGGLPKAKGADSIMVIVDSLSKYADFIPLFHPYLAKDVAAIFVKEIVRLYCFLNSIVLDRNRIFHSAFLARAISLGCHQTKI